MPRRIRAVRRDANIYWLPAYWTRNNLGCTNQAGAAGRVFLTPLYIERDMTISRIDVVISVAGGAGSVLRIGLYQDNGRSPLGGALLEDSGNLNANVVAPVSFVLAATRALTKGLYWIALETDNAVVNFLRSVATMLFNEVGVEMMASCYYDRAGGYGALTNPCPAVTWSANARVQCAVRVSSIDD